MREQAQRGLKALMGCAGYQREVEERHNDPGCALGHKRSLVDAFFKPYSETDSVGVTGEIKP